MTFQKLVKSMKNYTDSNNKDIDLKDFVRKEELSEVAKSNDYNDLDNTPEINNDIEEEGVLWDSVKISDGLLNLLSNKYDSVELTGNQLLFYANGLVKKTLTIPISTGGTGANGTPGKDGIGIKSIAKTKTVGLVDTYTITFTNDTTTTFTVQNGSDGEDGVGIMGVEKISTVGLVDTYNMRFTDGTSFRFNITNGRDGAGGEGSGTAGRDGVGISGIQKTSTTGLVDTYTIAFTNGNTFDFDITNGRDGADGADGRDGINGRNGANGVGILNITKTASNDNIDIYTINYTDGTTSEFSVSNGRNGSDGVDGKNGTSIVWKGDLSAHPSNPQNGWAYRNTTEGKTFIYQDNTWYQMTIDGTDGQDGTDGLSIVWLGELDTPPGDPQLNWCYRDRQNGKIYIYNGLAWELMVLDGNDGVDGADGQDGLSVYITYNDSTTIPSKPTGDGTTNGWHTEATSSSVWMSQKVSDSASTGEWGNPIKIKGENGTNGNDGKDGTSVTILGTYGSKSELNTAHSSGNTNGDGYIVNGDLYIWDGSAFINMGQIKGSDGISSYIHIKYSNDGFSFTENNGETIGDYIGIYVDSTEADSTNFSDYRWKKIVGQQGLQGIQGVKGDQGVPGKDGATYYTWIKYADDANGTNMSDDPTGKEYIGLAYNKTTQQESTNKSDYTWSKFKGSDGVDGAKGADGTTYYTWIKYADDANGNGMSDDPTGKEYIGLAYNKTTKTESTNKSDYTWSKFKGDKGVDGSNGKTSYFHIKYSNDGGSTFTDNNGETTGIYIGTYVDFIATDSTNVSDYTWHRLEGLQGEKGEQGIPGTNGTNGKTSYLHIKYSNDGGTTFTSNNGEDVGIYIGILVDFNPNDSTTPSDYKWSRIKGDKGDQGEADFNVLNMTYNELVSRNSSVLRQIADTLKNSLLTADINTLNTSKSNVSNSFNQVKSAFTRLSNNKTSDNYNAYISAVNTWNDYCGIALGACTIAIQNKNSHELSNKLTNDRETVFNLLTNNSSDQGIFKDTSGKIFINAEYIKSGDLNISNSISTKYLTVDYINSSRVPEMLAEKTTVSVSTSGSDGNDFDDGAVFRTLQGAIDACPICLNGNSVYINITSDVYEDVEIRGKTGGTIYINCNGNQFYGNIKIWDCTAVLIYGGSTSASPTTLPVLKPSKLYAYDGYNYSIIAIRTSYVYLKDFQVYGKTNSSDNSLNYAIGASRNATFEIRNVKVLGSDNGVMSTRGAHVLEEDCSGKCNRYGHRIYRAGKISITNGTAIGGAISNVSIRDGCQCIYDSSNVTFDSSSAVGSNDNSTTNTNTVTYTSNNGYSYRTGNACSYANTWSTDNVVRQGQWTASTGFNKGLWFFGNKFADLAGKTITKVVISVLRQQAGVYGSSANLQLCYHNYASKTSGNPTVSFIKAVSIPAYDGNRYSFTITNSSVLTGIQNGTIKGFAAYSTGASYMGFSASCKVSIYYK